ncbi:DUF6544 family protein [Flavitalea flava]
MGKILSNRNYKRDLTRLLSLSPDICHKTFQFRRLTGLPGPVQRYFRYVLKEGQPYISSVRLRHTGQFKTGLKGKWTNIEGEEYFTTENPGFIWKGSTRYFTAFDSYLEGKGRLQVYLLSLFRILKGEGVAYNQGELLRWLGESVWFPTNLMPDGRNKPDKVLKWIPVDEQTAMLNLRYYDQLLQFKVHFNEKGEIAEMETKRFMDKKRLETWILQMDAYKEINGVHIPTKAKAIWRLEEGDFCYANFDITEIEYNCTKRKK